MTKRFGIQLFASLVIVSHAQLCSASVVDMLGPGLKLLWLIIFLVYCVPALFVLGAVARRRRRFFKAHLVVVALGVVAAVVTCIPRGPFPGSWDAPIVVGSWLVNWVTFISYLTQSAIVHPRVPRR